MLTDSIPANGEHIYVFGTFSLKNVGQGRLISTPPSTQLPTFIPQTSH